MILFCVPKKQVDHIKGYVEHKAASLRDEFRILQYEDLVKQTESPPGTYVLSSLDQLTASIHELLIETHTQLEGLPGFRFLNHPVRTLQRFELLNELYLRGLNEFRAVRGNGKLKGLRFPVFLRAERRHDGAISPLLHSDAKVRSALGKAVIQGYDLRELLVVEYCETASEGMYRKYAAFIVGDKIIPRSLNYGKNWMLKHAGTEFTTSMAHEELEYVTKNPHEEELKEIFRVAQIQYGRIDYSIKDSRIQTWEINLYPTIGRFVGPPSIAMPPEVDAIREKSRRHFFSEFESAWKAVNLPGSELPPVEIRIDQDVAGSEDFIRPATGREILRKVVRPAKPVIERLSPPFLFLLGSLARLRRS